MRRLLTVFGTAGLFTQMLLAQALPQAPKPFSLCPAPQVLREQQKLGISQNSLDRIGYTSQRNGTP